MGGREVSRPYRVFRRETASGFLSFWHRQKAVFYVFCFGAPSIYPLILKCGKVNDFALPLSNNF